MRVPGAVDVGTFLVREAAAKAQGRLIREAAALRGVRDEARLPAPHRREAARRAEALHVVDHPYGRK